MRLTTYHKQAFVRAVLDDVPSVDYQAQMQRLLVDAAIAAMPEPVKKIYKDPKLKDWVKHSFFSTPSNFSNVCVPVPHPEDLRNPELDAQVKVLADAHYKQRDDRIALRHKLECAIGGCNTIKQAHTLLPEFAAYLPEEDKPTKNLPAVANLAVSLMEAGWKARKA